MDAKRCTRVVYEMLLTIAVATAAYAQDVPSDSVSAAPTGTPSTTTGGLNPDMKLDDLVKQDVVVPALSTVVTTVDRQESTVGRSAAAVFVITQDMIKRSGVRSIPEALRMAPGIEVAKINSSTWAISARGFQGRFANKLLVQIDQRVVYSPTLFGGVFWDVQDVVLADVERIEVIRGPGTVAWGSNAVNGVINIITKKSSDTQGALIQSGGGDQERDFNTVRYGSKIGNDLSWRAYGQQFDRNSGFSTTGENDSWRQQRGGFRSDWTPTKEDTVRVQGDIYNGSEGEQFTNTRRFPPGRVTVNDQVKVSGGNVLTSYNRVLDEDTSWQFLSYYDRLTRNFTAFDMTQDTYSLDFQYQFSPAEFHQFITGVNYRRVQDFTSGGFSFSMTPPDFATQWASVFAQDTMTLEEDYLYLTLGARLEQHTFGNFQPEPTARLLWLPSKRQSAWIAVSRAARMPTRFDTSLHERVFSRGSVFFDGTGNPNQKAENVMSYEIGYRAAPTDDFTWDIAGYISEYHNLFGFGPPGVPFLLPPPPNFVVLIPVPFANNTRALTYGFETTATYRLSESWRLYGSYSLFEAQAQTTETFNIAVPAITGGTPHNVVYLRSSWDLANNVQFDLIGRYVDRVTAPTQDIPKYIEMDTRLSWRATKTLEFSLVGQNLLNPHHLEYRDNFPATMGMHSTEVRRGVYGMVTWTY
ncbi:MAG: TonB-dependent receptor [Planctomycetia bacterium]|nr:TonB-dependent receptor [Planctomycetia bacterium]